MINSNWWRQLHRLMAESCRRGCQTPNQGGRSRDSAGCVRWIGWFPVQQVARNPLAGRWLMSPTMCSSQLLLLLVALRSLLAAWRSVVFCRRKLITKGRRRRRAGCLLLRRQTAVMDDVDGRSRCIRRLLYEWSAAWPVRRRDVSRPPARHKGHAARLSTATGTVIRRLCAPSLALSLPLLHMHWWYEIYPALYTAKQPLTIALGDSYLTTFRRQNTVV